MKHVAVAAIASLVILLSTFSAWAEVKTLVEHNDNDHATADFKFKNIPAPAKDDAGTKAKITIVDGVKDDNSGDTAKLNDGKGPSEHDQPDENFFFNYDTAGGRLLFDLGAPANVRQVNTYSWHPSTRGPQLYKLYASDGSGNGFNAQPKAGVDPAKAGWKLIASVDTRPKAGEEGGGQYGVSISDPAGDLGKFRYLLFDIARTGADEHFDNTFYSELDIVTDAPAAKAEARVAAAVVVADAGGQNALTDEEKKAGWKLLFDGQTLQGWHNFKKPDVRPGWQVKDGALACVDPKNAGDLCTADKYDWFELSLEYNISKGGNSGIIYHITGEGGAVWQTGPELQLQDNNEAHDPILSGWLYQLYKPEIDTKTGKPVDATKPAGEWNQVRLILSPTKCEHYINGVKYFEYVLGSDDFNDRVAKSKFGKMKNFAKSNSGYIALQGDHGQVSFRNIKIRPIEAK
jgi:hypothetical protein